MPQKEKAALRRQLLAARLAIPRPQKQQLDAAICAHIAAHPAFLAADALLAYMPVRGEIDLTPLIETAKVRDIPVYFPRCEGDGMIFRLFTEESALTPDRFGILAPPTSAPTLTPTQKTLCLVPGLAAGRDGTRLGYGGGFYDRFLPRFAGYALFALYKQFVFDTLPHEMHDISAAHILTEKGEL